MNKYGCITNGSDDVWPIIGRKCSKLVLTNDGRLVLVNSANDEIWTSMPKAIMPDITEKAGEWSYGYGARGDAFNEFDIETKEGKQRQITRLVASANKWWSVAQNTSSKAHTDNQHITYPPKSDGAFVFHPGQQANQNSKARFTAASDGTYTFKVLWKLVDAQGKKVSAEVYTNARSKTSETYATILKQDLDNTTPEKAMYKEFTVELKVGEWVSIEVENGNSHYYNDSTLVEMSVSKAN